MENTTEKICDNCGEKLPNDSSFCIKCGAKVDEGGQDIEQVEKQVNILEKHKKKICIGLAVVVAVALIGFIVNAVQAANLKKELMRDWQTVEGDDGAYILCVLDFSEDEIEYRLETGYSWMDMMVDTYEYKVISGNKIKVKIVDDEWWTIEIEFNEDKTMMTVSPGMTSTDEEEYWFNFDE